MAGLVAVMQRFLASLMQLLIDNRDMPMPQVVLEGYFDMVGEVLGPLESAYMGEMLHQAYGNTHNPDLLFVGAVVQNCFGKDTTCRTGVEVKGTDENGYPITEVSNLPPDANGIEELCTDPRYSRHCNKGWIQVLYVNETKSKGPTTVRYLAIRLWGGETHYMQGDSHLRFAPSWDRLYKEELMLAGSYPKAILSSYPTAFKQDDPPYLEGTKAPRLCTCKFPDNKGMHSMIRINTGNDCKEDMGAPTQIAYIAAGFFFARYEFLNEVQFDAFLPWIFMGQRRSRCCFRRTRPDGTRMRRAKIGLPISIDRGT